MNDSGNDSSSSRSCSSGSSLSGGREDPKPRRNSLTSLMDDRRAKRQRRMAVSVTVDDDDGPDSPKNLMQRLSLVNKAVQLEDKTRRLLQLLSKHPLISHLSSDCLKRILNEFVLTEYNRSDTIFRRDDFDDKFYVVDKGFCCVEGDGGYMTESGIGSCFGDLSLVQPSPKRVTLVALCPVAMWSIDGGLFRFLISAHQLQQYDMIKSFVRVHSRDLHLHLPSDISYVVDASTLAEFKLGDEVTSPTAPSLSQHETVFFVKEGEVELVTISSVDPPIRRTIRAVAVFGDLVCAPDFMPGYYTARCVSDSCVIIATKNIIFQRLPYLRARLSRFQA